MSFVGLNKVVLSCERKKVYDLVENLCEDFVIVRTSEKVLATPMNLCVLVLEMN